MTSESSSAGWSALLSPVGVLAALLIVGTVVGAAIIWWPFTKEAPPPSELIGEEPEPSGPPIFEDATASAGIHFTYHNGQEAGNYAILESLGGGIGLIDYDGDGFLDVFIPGGGYFDGPDKKQVKGHPCKLYRNLGNGKFKDVTKEAGLDHLADGQPWFYTHGCAVADYDRDGWPDLLVTGWGRVALFHNEPVDPKNPSKGRRFREVSRAAGLVNCDWTTSAAWADLDGDGYPDLYLCQYVDWSPDHNPKCHGYTPNIPRDVCPPKEFKGREHLLYRNNGNGTFTNVTRPAGLNVYSKKDSRGHQVNVGKGLGVMITDLNNDGKPDIYVANDTVNKLLYMNRTRRHFFGTRITLEEVGEATGTAMDDNAVSNGSMGVTAGDFNHSGFASMFVTNYEGENHGLYRNDGKEVFAFSTQTAGIAAIGQEFVGFGTWFVDLDNRGWLDIVIINGHVIRFPVRAGLRQRPILFANEDGKRFNKINKRGGTYFQTDHMGRGLAVGDLTNNGRADLVISHVNDPVAVLRNIAGRDGQRNHWLGIELVGRGFRDVVGARVILEANGVRQTAFTLGGASYLSACDQRLRFGLGQATRIDRVTVAWPWGKTQVFEGRQFQADHYWRLVEDQAKAEPWTGRAAYLKAKR